METIIIKESESYHSVKKHIVTSFITCVYSTLSLVFTSGMRDRDRPAGAAAIDPHNCVDECSTSTG